MLKRLLPLLLLFGILTGCQGHPQETPPVFTPPAEWTEDSLDAAFRQAMTGQEHIVQDALCLSEEGYIGVVLSTDPSEGSIVLTLMDPNGQIAGAYTLAAELNGEPDFSYQGEGAFSFYIQGESGRECCTITCCQDAEGSFTFTLTQTAA